MFMHSQRIKEMLNNDNCFDSFIESAKKKNFMDFYINENEILLVRMDQSDHKILLVQKTSGLPLYGVYYILFKPESKLKYYDLALNNQLLLSVFKNRSIVLEFDAVELPSDETFLKYANIGFGMIK